jgi:cell division protein FtsB
MSKRWEELAPDQKLDLLHSDLQKTTLIIHSLSDHRAELQAEIGHLRTELTQLKARIALLEQGADKPA